MSDDLFTKTEKAKHIIKDRRVKKKLKPVPSKFWCGTFESKTTICCYNHFIGLPEKNGRQHPLYDYEEQLEQDYRSHQQIVILKATGLGITEFFLRLTEHEALTNPIFHNSQIGIFTGPNLDLAMRQITRIKKHLQDKIPFEGDAYTIVFGTCTIKAFPSMNINAARSLPNPKLLLIDEAAFFGMRDDEEVRAIAERYIAKSNPKIVIYSTPGLPDGFFYNMLKEESSPYKKIYLPYLIGINKIYTQQEIEKAKKSPSFEREYNLQWGFGSGDIFDLKTLEEISREEYSLSPVTDNVTIAVDPRYGSSKFGVVIVERLDGITYVLFASQFERPSQTDMIGRVKSLVDTYHCRTICIDGSNPGFIAEFSNAKPINFKERGQIMTDNAAMKVLKGEVRIHPKFGELLQQLRAVKKNEKGTPDKNRLSFDLGDSFLMALHEFHHEIYGAILKGD